MTPHEEAYFERCKLALETTFNYLRENTESLHEAIETQFGVCAHCIFIGAYANMLGAAALHWLNQPGQTRTKEELIATITSIFIRALEEGKPLPLDPNHDDHSQSYASPTHPGSTSTQ